MVHVLIGIIIGMLIGRFFRAPRECPRNIRGYDCKGRQCDHGDIAYYGAKHDQALDRDNISFKGPF